MLGLAWLAVEMSGARGGADGVGPAGAAPREVPLSRAELTPPAVPVIGAEVASSSAVAQHEPPHREAAPATVVGIAGRVVSLDGEIDLSTVRVVLWAERTAPNCAQFRAAGPRAKGMRLVHAASDGTFAIEDLDPATRYHLRAGGGGRASLWLSDPIAPGGEPVTLELARVKGLRVELVGLDGKPPRAPPELLGDPFVLSGSALNRRGAQLEPWEQELVGVPGTGCATELGPWHRLVVLSSPPDQLTFGPITCYAEVPGYTVEQPTYWAEPVREFVAVEKLVLRPTTSGWTALEVEFVGLGAELQAQLTKSTPLGTLVLEHEQASGILLRLDGPATPRRFEGLPRGKVGWMFESYEGYVWPEDRSLVPLELGEGVARATVDLSGTGGIRVDFEAGTRPDPLPIKHLGLTHEPGGRTKQMEADSLPHSLLLVEAGVWRVTSVGALDEARGVYFLRKLHDGPAVQVEPGRVATLALSSSPDAYLPRKR